MPSARRTLRILGTRGIPAAHGGFETFAEQLALYLTNAGWQVVVYCQEDGRGPIHEDAWRDIRRVHIPVAQTGPKGTIVFDWRATLHAARAGDLCLVLGYNTAVFCAVLRARGIPNLINMDGIEWARAKWGAVAKLWFWLNDWAGCWLGNHLFADHPEIKRHLETRVDGSKITTIPYGADRITECPVEPIRALGLEPGRYLSVIARPEPENSILEIVRGFSSRPRDVLLVVLGSYSESNAYHRAVKAAAGAQVRFVGPIYDKPVVQAIRYHSRLYVHGHQVGGTNPSLVEALGATNAVIAHDNRFNRWVAGDGAAYFRDAAGFSDVLDAVLADPERIERMRLASATRFQEAFTWEAVLGDYEATLARHLPATAGRG